jgi:hypothetical protein
MVKGVVVQLSGTPPETFHRTGSTNAFGALLEALRDRNHGFARKLIGLIYLPKRVVAVGH